METKNRWNWVEFYTTQFERNQVPWWNDSCHRTDESFYGTMHFAMNTQTKINYEHIICTSTGWIVFNSHWSLRCMKGTLVPPAMMDDQSHWSDFFVKALTKNIALFVSTTIHWIILARNMDGRRRCRRPRERVDYGTIGEGALIISVLEMPALTLKSVQLDPGVSGLKRWYEIIIQLLLNAKFFL